MKNHYIIILFLLLSLKLVAQETMDSPRIEIFTLVEDPSPNPTGSFSYTLSAVGTVWKVIRSSSTEFEYDIDINNEASGGTVNPIINTLYLQYTGFNFIPFDSHDYPEFGFGLYKLQLSPSRYFYLDYRDTRYGSYNYCTGHCADIWVKYKVDTGELYLSSNPSDWSDAIPNRTYLRIWDIKGQGSQEVSTRVDDFWQNCLALIPTSNNHPRLVWGPKPNFNSTSYRLYRKITTSSGQQINFISTTETSYIDNEFTIGTKNGQDFVEYWVKAMNDQNQESDETNHVNTQGISELQWKINQEIQNSTIDFKLNQNYPNPFNPATRISYSIKEEGLVTLKIYNVLGKEVITLVNENKPSGNYEAEFNASQLPSGMYIYKLQAGNFTSVSKMILMK